MAVTPESHKKSRKKSVTPQGKGGSTPQGAVSKAKTPESQKGQTVTPKIQKGQTQTPGSRKSSSATSQVGDSINKTPQLQKGKNVTPQSQKGHIQTPGSQKSSGISSEFSKGKGQTQTPSEKMPTKSPKSEKWQATTPKMQKGQATTPQSQSAEKQKFHEYVTPKLKVSPATPGSQKSPKNSQQTGAGSNQQSKAGSPATKLQSSNKKRKLDEDESSSYDSAEEDFEALIGHPKKMKTEDVSPSSIKVTQQSGSKITDKKQPLIPVMGKPTTIGKQSGDKLVTGMKRPFESDSDSEAEDDDDDDEDEEDEDDDESSDDDFDTTPVEQQSPPSEVAVKKKKVPTATLR